MLEIKAIIQPFMLEKVLEALAAQPQLPGITISQVIGWGRSRAAAEKEKVVEAGHTLAKKTKIEIVVPEELASEVERVIALAAHTGGTGDGKIFLYDVRRVLKIRTGETGPAAI